MEEVIRGIRESRQIMNDSIKEIKNNYRSFLKNQRDYLNEIYKQYFGKKCYLTEPNDENNRSEQYIFNGFVTDFDRIIFVVHKIKSDGTAYKNNVKNSVCIENNKIVFTD